MFIVGGISIIIYIVAILMISTNIYEFEKDKKIQFIIVGVAIILISTWFIIQISSNGIYMDNKEVLYIAKVTSILIFAPINTILVLPYLGNLINQYKQKRLNEETIRKKIIRFLVVLSIIVIVEINYIKSFEIGLVSSIV